jgi:hypothetical protein
MALMRRRQGGSERDRRDGQGEERRGEAMRKKQKQEAEAVRPKYDLRLAKRESRVEEPG